MAFEYKDHRPLFGDREVDPEEARNRVMELLDFYTERLNLYRKDLAEQLHMSEPQLSVFCTGQRFSEKTLLRVCYMLGISVDYVLFGENTGLVAKFKMDVLKKKIADDEEYINRLEEGPQ